MTWGGLRGALTLVLALAATEHPALGADVPALRRRARHRLRAVHAVRQRHDLAPGDRACSGSTGCRRATRCCATGCWRCPMPRSATPCAPWRRIMRCRDAAIAQVVEPYRAWIAAADARDAAEALTRARPARDRPGGARQPGTDAGTLSAHRPHRIAGRRAGPAAQRRGPDRRRAQRRPGRLPSGGRSARSPSRSFPRSPISSTGISASSGSLADRLADRVELLLVTRLLIDQAAGLQRSAHLGAIFGTRIAGVAGTIVRGVAEQVDDALDALRRQYPDYVAALEVRFLRQSALRQEMGRYQALFDEGLIPRELYDDLRRACRRQRARRGAAALRHRPRHAAPGRAARHAVADSDQRQLDRLAKLLRPRFTVPGERIIRDGDRADACYFIASGAVEVRLPDRAIRLGSGDFFGELALLTGRPRQADVVALTYCRLLVLRRADFQSLPGGQPGRAGGDRPCRTRAAGNEPGYDGRRRSTEPRRLMKCRRFA